MGVLLLEASLERVITRSIDLKIAGHVQAVLEENGIYEHPTKECVRIMV
jgi:hypothetical protein